MPILCIVRHGQSIWNLENRFTGEEDVALTELGRKEAREAGERLAGAGYSFSCAYTSVLKRAIETCELVLAAMGCPDLPVIRDRALNERNYGDLQGLNKHEIAQQYGEEQVNNWRRSYRMRPPGGESLQDTAMRVLHYYSTNIAPRLAGGENILIVAHGNSLRSLMMKLESLDEEKIAHTDLPTGRPRMYHFDEKMNLLEVKYL